MHRQPDQADPRIPRLGQPGQSVYRYPQQIPPPRQPDLPGQLRAPVPFSPQPRKGSHASTCVIFGVLLALVGAIAPRIPGYLTSQSGVRYSVASYHAVCTSGRGELVQAGHSAIAGQCSQAGLLLTLGWVAVAAGVLLVLAGVLLKMRKQPT